ncbi:MAG: HAMP domain-containing histidine kinase [Nitrospirae bacterium]|nr:HAMP domain-containing histidine kinase [Nitrospirota bacterium]
MNLRRDIFRRTAALLGGLIFLCWLVLSFFAVVHNREGWRNFSRNDAVFLAGQSERLILWDDRVALRELFVSRKKLNPQIDDIYAEYGGTVSVHTFPSRPPAGLAGINPPGAGGVSEAVIRDPVGHVYYDVAAQVGGTGASIHILVSRDRVDREAVDPVIVITAICVAGWLLSLIPAGYVARELTREVVETTQALERLNEELEGRVSERTAQLSSAVESLNAEVAERVRMEKEKEDLYAMVTHDMKTPITVIRGYVELLRDMGKMQDEDTAEMFGHIEHSSENLARIVNDFLAIARLGSGSMALNVTLTDMAGLVQETAGDCSALCAAKGVMMEQAAADGLPKALVDPGYVRRALANLIQNAVKFTQAGGNVTVSAKRSDKFGNCIEVSVRDNGVGIPPDEQERVFERYYRSKTAGGVKGSGLGLAVVKAVADAHGGRVELTSEVGKGSEFRLYLPAAG